MDRRNICIFSANYYPFLGGVEIFTKNLSSALVQEGCSVTVVTNNATDSPLHEVTLEGIEIYRLPCLPVLRGRMPIPLKNAAWHDAVHTIMERHWDCILVNTRFYLHSLLGLRVAKNQHLTPIVCEHGSAYLSIGNRFADVFVRLWEHIVTAAVKRYKPAFCAVSQKAADWLSTFGISCDTVLSNSIDAEAYRKSSSGRNFREELGLADDDFIVCFVGRFVPEKGVTKLVEAMESIKDPEIKLILAGDGPLRGKVDSCAGNSIFNVGRLQSADVAALMLQSNLLCLPTRSEGFCTTLLESAACSLPALITPVGGTDELMPSSEYGTLLPADCTPSTIASEIRHLHQRPDLLELQGQNVHNLVERDYSWQRTACTLMDINRSVQQRNK